MNSYSVSILLNILLSMFCIIWILPLLCLNKFFNFSLYQGIANFILLISGQIEIAKEAFYLIWRGICDCFSGIFELQNYLSPLNNDLTRENVERISVRDNHSQGDVRHKVRSILYKCFSFGLYFVLSDLLFDRFLLQFLFVQLVEWTGEDVNSYSVKILDKILRSMFSILWIFPLLCVSKFLNFSWYQDIANILLLESGQKKYGGNIKISDFYADQMKSLVLQMIFCCQGSAIYSVNYLLFYIYHPIIPWYVEDTWFLFHRALLWSLCAFEYKWVYSGWPLHRRILNISIKWPYYFGFGLLLALINLFSSSFIFSLIVSTLFPVYLISSTVTQDHLCPAFCDPCQIFKCSDYLSEFIIKNAIKVLNSALGSS